MAKKRRTCGVCDAPLPCEYVYRLWHVRKRRRMHLNPPLDVAERPRGECHYCGNYAETRDHVIPRHLGGPTVEWNIIPACSFCNQAKGHITYEKFTGLDMLPLRCREAGWMSTEQWQQAQQEAG